MYQKSFVEFFASEDIVEKLEKAVSNVKGVVDFLAGNNMVRNVFFFCSTAPSAAAAYLSCCLRKG